MLGRSPKAGRGRLSRIVVRAASIAATAKEVTGMRSESEATTDPAADVLSMIRGQWVSLVLRATVELGILDALAEPMRADELAVAIGADSPTLRRLLLVLDDLGLVAHDGDRYFVGAAGELLRSGHPSDLRSLAVMQTERANIAAWGALADSVRTGQASFEAVNGINSWDYVAADPERAARFNAAMARRGVAQATAIRGGCDLAEVATIVDVGGGRGGMLVSLLEGEPRLRAIVADLPHVAAEADHAFAAAGLGERAHGVAADFFASVPTGGDAYVVSNVLHDWSDDDCRRILRTVRAAMDPGARLWIVEMVLGSEGRTPAQDRDLHLVDLHMLVMFGARERTADEYGDLLVAAGFERGTLLATGSPWDVVESRPV
jgi:O-methyltransferase domain/Dimerisation domain